MCDNNDIVTISRTEYEDYIDMKQKHVVLNQTVARLERDLEFHAISASNLEKIRDFNARQREEQYLYNNLLLKNCPGMLFYLDLDLKFILGSEMGLDFLCHTSESALQGMSFDELCGRIFKEEDVGILRKLCAQSLRNLESYEEHYDILCIGGQEMKLRIKVAPAIDDADNRRGVTLVIQDVTELSNEREKAVNASKAKSTFLANMSHDIRTPMNAIIGMAEVLMNEPLSVRQKGYAEDILNASSSLLSLINDILDLSKIEEGKLKIVSVEYKLTRLLDNINSMFGYSANNRGIEYRFRRSDEVPEYAVGDDVRVKQVLTNIIGNAIKFTSEGYVLFNAFVEGDRLCFDISDTGTGIKEENIHKIFRPFNQLGEDNQRYLQGSGLGLSITRNLVEMMGGTIGVESVYSKGTTFRIRLPLVRAGADTPVRRTPLKAFSFIQAPDADVLVVDDNLVNLKVAVSLLNLCGIKADTAINGMMAIERIAKKKYDIVFLDHMMPGMDGIQTTSEIRKNGYTAEDLPIIALSANALEGARQMYIDGGMQDFLIKPIDKAELNEILLKWLPVEKIVKREKPEDYTAVVDKARKIKDIDIDYAIKNANGDAETFVKHQTVLRRNLPMIISSLDNETDNVIKVTGIMNGLRMLLHNAGAIELSRVAAEIQNNSQKESLDSVYKLIPEFLNGLKRLSNECEEAFGSHENKTKALK